jgi:NAD-reducing hydrogenase small subunit
LTDIKELGECDIGMIEGGVCNAENVHVLMEFRAHCKTLIAMGACALNGGIPAMRNQFALKDCLEESYLRGIGLVDAANSQRPGNSAVARPGASDARGGQD